MAKVIEIKDNYKILETSRGFVVANTNLEYKNHAHFRKLSDIYKLINILNKGLMPISKYWREAARRLLTEEEYESLRDKRKPRYVNINKGVRS